MKQKRQIEVLARGVCVKRGKLLLCHSKGASNTYLPGGHVEFTEAARGSLAREIREELGVKAQIGRFLGAVEHTFVQHGEPHCEINLVFEMRIPALDPRREPSAREDHIEFRWVPIGGLEASALEPSVLRGTLGKWLSAGWRGDRWASTIPPA